MDNKNIVKNYIKENNFKHPHDIKHEMCEFICSKVDGPMKIDTDYDPMAVSVTTWLYYMFSPDMDIYELVRELYMALDDIEESTYNSAYNDYKKKLQKIGKKIYNKTKDDSMTNFSHDKAGLETAFYVICNFSGMKNTDNADEIRFAYKTLNAAFHGIGMWRY